MDVYKPYFNATERAKKNNFNEDQMQFIETTPYDKIYNKLCKFIQKSFLMERLRKKKHSFKVTGVSTASNRSS
jgi:hypothetical protein